MVTFLENQMANYFLVLQKNPSLSTDSNSTYIQCLLSASTTHIREQNQKIPARVTLNSVVTLLLIAGEGRVRKA